MSPARESKNNSSYIGIWKGQREYSLTALNQGEDQNLKHISEILNFWQFFSLCFPANP